MLLMLLYGVIRYAHMLRYYAMRFIIFLILIAIIYG